MVFKVGDKVAYRHSPSLLVGVIVHIDEKAVRDPLVWRYVDKADGKLGAINGRHLDGTTGYNSEERYDLVHYVEPKEFKFVAVRWKHNCQVVVHQLYDDRDKDSWLSARENSGELVILERFTKLYPIT